MKDKWTDKEICILKEKYLTHGSNIPELKNRTTASIHTRARMLGLKIQNCIPWTEDELEILKLQYPLCGTNIPQLNRSISSISSKASKMGLKSENKWSDEEIEILKHQYPVSGTNIPELNRSKKSINKKAYNLKLRKTKAPKQQIAKQASSKPKLNREYGIATRWNSDDIQTLIDLYPVLGSDIPALLDKYTAKSIRVKAGRLNLASGIHTCHDHKGNRYDSMEKMCEHYSISRQTFYKRLKLGWSLEKALTTSVHSAWTESEINILKEKYPAYGVKIPELSHRTYGTIRKMARKYKLYKDESTIKDTVGKYVPNKCGVRIALQKYEYINKNNKYKYHYVFEDGYKNTVTYNNAYIVSHPVLSQPYNSNRKLYFGFDIKLIGISGNGADVYYECECKSCGHKNLMTPKEMIEHAQTYHKNAE